MDFSELNCTVDKSTKTIKFNDKDITVLNYLPQEEKFEIVNSVLLGSYDQETHVYKRIIADTLMTLYIVEKYTDIVYSEEDKADCGLLYDKIVNSGLWGKIRSAIPEDEFARVKYLIEFTMEDYTKYENSVYGIMNGIVEDFKNTDVDVTALKEKLTAKENLDLVEGLLSNSLA